MRDMESLKVNLWVGGEGYALPLVAPLGAKETKMSKRMMLVSVFVVLAAVVFSGCTGGTITIGEVTNSAVEDLKTNTKTVVEGGTTAIDVVIRVKIVEPIKIQINDVAGDAEDLVDAAKSDFVGQLCGGIGQETCDFIESQVK